MKGLSSQLGPWCLLIIVCLAVSGCATGRKSMPAAASDVAIWRECNYPDYGVSFRYPAEAVFGTLGGLLPGFTTVDGRQEAPLDLHFRPTHSRRLLAGVSYGFSIRITMLTDAAKLNPRSARVHGWTSEPPIDLYPFRSPEMSGSLENAVEQLYLGGPMEWTERNPVAVDGRQGIWFAGWDDRLKDSKFFHEIIAVPLSDRKILIVQAVHFRVRSEKELRIERGVVKAVVDTMRLPLRSG